MLILAAALPCLRVLLLKRTGFRCALLLFCSAIPSDLRDPISGSRSTPGSMPARDKVDAVGLLHQHRRSHSRRGFLARALGATFTGATLLERAALLATRARAQSKGPLPKLFEIEKVAEGVYAAVANGRA